MFKQMSKPKKKTGGFFKFRRSVPDLSEWGKLDEKLLGYSDKEDLEKMEQLLMKKTVIPTKRDPNGHSVFHRAAMKGQLPVIELLLQHKADTNALDATGRTPAHCAARHGHSDVLEKLLQENDNAFATDNNEMMPLHHACWSGSLECVHLLLVQEAPVNVADKELRTPLIIAAYIGNASICKVLVECGAELDRRDVHKRTALMIASGQGHMAVCELLVKKGADVLLTDTQGHNASWHALHGNCPEVKKILDNAPSKASWNLDGLGKGDPALSPGQVDMITSFHDDSAYSYDGDADPTEYGVVPMEEFQDGDDEPEDEEEEEDEEGDTTQASVTESQESTLERERDSSFMRVRFTSPLVENAISQSEDSPMTPTDSRGHGNKGHNTEEMEEELDMVTKELAQVNLEKRKLQDAIAQLKRPAKSPTPMDIQIQECQQQQRLEELERLKEMLETEQKNSKMLKEEIESFKEQQSKKGSQVSLHRRNSWGSSDEDIFASNTKHLQSITVSESALDSNLLIKLQNQVLLLSHENEDLKKKMDETIAEKRRAQELIDQTHSEPLKPRSQLPDQSAPKESPAVAPTCLEAQGDAPANLQSPSLQKKDKIVMVEKSSETMETATDTTVKSAMAPVITERELHLMVQFQELQGKYLMDTKEIKDKHEGEIKELQKKFQCEKMEMEEIHAVESRSLREKLEGDIEQMEKEHEILVKSVRDEAKTIHANLDTAHKKLHEKKNEMKEQIARLTEEVANLAKGKQDLVAQMKASEVKLEMITAQKNSLEADVKNAQNMNEELQSTANAASQRVEDLENDKRNLEAEMILMKSDLSDVKRCLEEAKSSLEISEANNKRFEEEMVRIQEEEEKILYSLKELQEENDKLRKQIDQVKTDHVVTINERESLAEKLKTYESTYNLRDFQVIEVRKELEHALVQKQDLADQVTQMEQKHAEMQSQLQAMESVVAASTEEANKIVDLRAEIVKGVEANKMLRGQLERKESEINRWKTELTSTKTLLEKRDLSSVEDDNSKLRKENLKLLDKVDEMKEQLQQKNNKLEKAESQGDTKSQDQILSLIGENAKLKNDLKFLKSNYSANHETLLFNYEKVKKDLSNAKKDKESMKQDVEKLKRDIETAKNEALSARRANEEKKKASRSPEIKLVEAENQKLLNDLAALKRIVDSQMSAMDRMKLQIKSDAEARTEFEKLQGETESLKSELDQMEGSIEKKRSEIMGDKEIKIELEVVLAERDSLVQERDELLEKNKEKTKKIKKLESEMFKGDHSDSLKKSLQSEKHKATKYENSTKSFQQKCQALEVHTTKLEADHIAMKEEIEGLKTNLTSSTKEVESLTSELTQLKDAKKRIESELDKESRVDNIKIERENWAKGRQYIGQVVTEFERKHKVLMEDINAKKAKNATLEKNLQDANKKIQSAEKEITKLQQGNKTLKGTVEGLQVSLSEAKARIKGCITENEQLLVEMKDLQNVNQGLREEIDALNKECDSLKDKCLSLQADQVDHILTGPGLEQSPRSTKMQELESELIRVKRQNSELFMNIESKCKQDPKDKEKWITEHKIRCLKEELSLMQQKSEDTEKHHKNIVSTYRSHLLNAMEGNMDPDVQEALQHIIKLRSNEAPY